MSFHLDLIDFTVIVRLESSSEVPPRLSARVSKRKVKKKFQSASEKSKVLATIPASLSLP